MKITKKQLDIFNAHLDAYRNDSFTRDLICYGDSIKTVIERGETSKELWVYMVDKEVSMTSKLMMSPKFLGFVSGKAKQDLRNGFKRILTNMEIL